MLKSVDLVGPVYSDLVFIARRMRVLDAEEIFPLVSGGTPEDLAFQTLAVGGLARVALFDLEPVAAYGAHMSRPGIWQVWMFATDKWKSVGRAVTMDIRRRMMPEMLSEPSAVRAECWSMDGHDEAHRWLEVLGAIREATVEDYGPSRKVFHCYSWTRSRFERDGSFNHVFRTIRAKNTQAAGNASSPAAPGAAPDTGRSAGKRGGGRGASASIGREGPSVHDSVGCLG
jgi:hypothetical protein|tara:strand:- start:9589 stop:10275 length:687 start_codon:yes stop_codon:yes gene_type:complete